MNVLIIKNVSHEGPGTIEDFLKERSVEYSVVDFSGCDATEARIPDIRTFTHLVIMGGPMAVYESSGAPFFHYEVTMIRAFIKRARAVLGICLGAQMIAHALGAEVYAGKKEEVGWDSVNITPEGMSDPAFSSLSVDGAPEAEVFQWHGDTFDLPKKAVKLASSEGFPNQAFRYGDNVYALQFHIEVKPAMIAAWFGKEEGCNAKEMTDHARRIFPEYSRRAMKFYETFFA